jgi:outer membrane protein W
MRRFIAVAFMFAATSAFAGDTQLSVFTSNLGYAETKQYSEFTGGLGLALSRAITPRWSAELRVAEERHLGSLVSDSERRTLRVFPVDLLTEYRFSNSSRWTPYVNAGVRYVAEPAGRSLYGDRIDGQIGVGTSLRITPRFGLRFDVNGLLRSRDVYFDPLIRPSLGVTWRW